MIPNTARFLTDDLKLIEKPTKTYKLSMEEDHVTGTIDGMEAVKQAVFKMLNTDRYQYLIYSWNYGSEWEGLFGRPVSYVCLEAERHIREALTWDKRIQSVTDFTFDTALRGRVNINFTVHTTYGEFKWGKEISI